jgi:hypothetical protein
MNSYAIDKLTIYPYSTLSPYYTIVHIVLVIFTRIIFNQVKQHIKLRLEWFLGNNRSL